MDSIDSGLAPNIFLEAFQREMPSLVQGVDPVRLCEALRAEALLTDEMISRALDLSTPPERNRSMMLSLRRGMNEEIFNRFISCLASSGHESLVSKLKKTYLDVDSGFVSEEAAGPWQASLVEPGPITNLVVPREERDKRDWLATSFSRYKAKWLRSLRYNDDFADILEEEEVPPYILTRVEEKSRRRRVGVLLDLLPTAGLQTYDAFRIALEKTGQTKLLALLEEKPFSEGERQQIEQIKGEIAHIVPSFAICIATRERPADKIHLSIPRCPEKSDGFTMKNVIQELTKSFDNENVAELYDQLRPSLDFENPNNAIQQVIRELFNDRTATMSSLALFLCVSTKVAIKIIVTTPKDVVSLVKSVTDGLCQRFAFWLNQAGGWPAFVKEANPGIGVGVKSITWKRFLSSTKKQGTIILGPASPASDEPIRRLCGLLKNRLSMNVVTASEISDMVTLFDPDAQQLTTAFIRSSFCAVVVVTTREPCGRSKETDWLVDLVGSLTAADEIKRVIPIGLFGARKEDFLPSVRSLKVIDVFPDKKKWQLENNISTAVNKIKAEYDCIMQAIINSELHGGSELVIELRLHVKFRNAANMVEGLKKAHGIQIRSIIKSNLAEALSDLRKFLTGGFEICNIRVPGDDLEDPMIVEVIPYSRKVPQKILDGICNGNLGKLFREKVVYPDETPEWSMEVTVDEGRMTSVREKLERQAQMLDDDDDDDDDDDESDSMNTSSSSFMRSGEGPVSGEAGEVRRRGAQGGAGPEESPLGGAVRSSGRGSSNPETGEVVVNRSAVTNAARGRIVGDVFQRIIQGDEYNEYDLLTHLEMYQCDVALDKVRDGEGLNVLHMAVFSQALGNLHSVFYANLWGSLRQQVVQPGRRFANLTPRGLAERLMFKSNGPLVAEEFDYLEARFFSMSDLSKACLAGKKQFVERFLQHDSNGVNAGDSSGSTPLFYASAGGHVDLMELLMKHGADATVVNERRETCLDVAAGLGRAEAVGFLLRLGTSDTSAVDNAKMRPVEYAAVNGDLTTLNVFKNYGEPLDDKLVSLATKRQRMAMVRYLVEECHLGVEGLDDNLRTPIHNAAIQGHVELLQFLVEQGANLSHRDKMGRNLLHHLVEHYKDDIKHRQAVKYVIHLLKERGVFANMVRAHDKFGGKELMMLVRGRDKGRRAWHYVEVKRRLVTQFKTKLASGFIDVLEFGSVRHSGYGMNPGQDVLDEIDKLVDDRLSGDSKDCTPLHLAVFRDHTSLVTEFIALGADVNAKDHFGLTPLHLVGVTGNMEVAKLLEEKGASFNAKEVDGKTAKDLAEDNKQGKVLNFLRGQETFALVKNFVHEVEKHITKLDKKTLEKIRSTDRDVKDYVVGVLRDVQIDINISLLDLGSGPIMEASEPGHA